MAVRRFAAFLLLSSGAALLVALAGFLPTRKLAGEPGLMAMAAGCGVSLVASWLGALPIAIAAGSDGKAFASALLGSMALRFLVVLAGTLVLALGTEVARTPFLVWVGISYVVLLVVDTRFAVRSQQSKDAQQQ